MNLVPLARIIEEIQTIFPSELVSGMWLNLVDDRRLDELHARSLSVFSPVYLPIFERNGDLLCVHLVPGVAWRGSPWVVLPHDEADPILVATRLDRLPAGLITPPHWGEERVDEIWAAIEKFVHSIPGAALPAKDDFVPSAPREISYLRSKYDPDDGAAQTGWALSDPAASQEDQDVLGRVEAVLTRQPDDHYALAVAAIVRAALERDDAAGVARRALAHEYAWGWRHVGMFYMRSATAAGVLEQLRVIAMEGINDTDPFFVLKGTSFKQGKAALVLMTLAERLRAAGDEHGALIQLRNGGMIAGLHGALTVKWCEALAEQAGRLSPGDPAVQLAEHAARVIHLGP